MENYWLNAVKKAGRKDKTDRFLSKTCPKDGKMWQMDRFSGKSCQEEQKMYGFPVRF